MLLDNLQQSNLYLHNKTYTTSTNERDSWK